MLIHCRFPELKVRISLGLLTPAVFAAGAAELYLLGSWPGSLQEMG